MPESKTLRTTRRELPVDLSEADLEKLTTEIADTDDKIDAAEEELATVSAPIREQLKELRAERKALSETRRSGKQLQLVEITEKLWGRRVQVYRQDTGELVEDREALPGELQEDLPGTETVEAQPEKPKRARKPRVQQETR